MPESFQSLFAWLRRHTGWSNSRQSWEERGALVLLIVGAALLLAFRRSFNSGVLLALWATLILTGALLFRRGWLKLFGPVLFYDLVRMSRRNRHVLLRWLYVLLLALLIGWLYFVWRMSFHQNREPNRNDIIMLNVMLFYCFMILQMVMILLVTPAYVAGAIAEEKDRRTLEFLLATDLRNREIVLSKMLSRLFNILMIILAGLPILSILQVLGGVGPDLVLGGFAATVMTIAGLSGLSIACSAITRRSRDAILLAYMIMFVYGGVSLAVDGFARAPWLSSIVSFGIHWRIPWPDGGLRINVTVQDLVDWFACGNPIVTTIDLFNVTGGDVTAALPIVLPRYLTFHAVLSIVFPAWAVWRLRAIALKETYGETRRLPVFSRLLGRPRVGPWPMLWKELFAESGMKVGLLVKIVLGFILALLVLGSLAPAGFILADYIQRKERERTFEQDRAEYDALQRKLNSGQALTPQEQTRYNKLRNKAGLLYYQSAEKVLAQESNVWVRIAGTSVALLMLLFVAVRAAGSISGERDKQTFNELLVSPLSAESILFSKWLGAVASVRWCWIWLGLIWLTAAAMGGLMLPCIPALIVCWVIYAFFAAGVGMWFSAHAKNSLRAIIWTVLVCVFVSVGHWVLMSLFCYLPYALIGIARNADDHTIEYIAKLEWGQTPPLVLGWFAFLGEEFEGVDNKHSIHITLSSIFGLMTWSVATVGLGLLLAYRFRKMTNRMASSRASSFERYAPRRRPLPSIASGRPVSSRPAPAHSEITEVRPIREEAPRTTDGDGIIEVRPIAQEEGKPRAP